MELEKTLFRVHDRLLYHEYTRTITLIGILIFFPLGILSILILMTANYKFENKSICSDYLNQTQMGIFKNQTLLHQIFIVDSLNEDSKKDPFLTLYVSQMKELLTMHEKVREEHNFTVSQSYIPKSCYFDNFITSFTFQTSVGLEAILLNDIIGTFKNYNIHVRNNETKEQWYWSKSTIQSYDAKQGFIEKILTAAFEFVKINLAIFIQSAIASLYIKMTIICAPVFIIAMIECLSICGNREIQPQMLYRAFPWMGIYMNVLDLSQNRSKKYILLSFFLMLVLFYFLYLSTVYIGTLLVFFKPIPKTLDENFFGFMAVMEFATMLFMRARTTIYFAPKIIILYYMCFLLYVQYTCYGFFYLAFYAMFYLSLGTLCFFLYFVEIKAIHWNPQSPYTPTIDRPRCFYTPMFQLGWVNDIPHLWTMFYPLYGRSFFTPQQLAFVDRNYVLLNVVLQQGNQIANDNNIDVVNPVQQNQFNDEHHNADFQLNEPQELQQVGPNEEDLEQGYLYYLFSRNQLRNNLIDNRAN